MTTHALNNGHESHIHFAKPSSLNQKLHIVDPIYLTSHKSQNLETEMRLVARKREVEFDAKGQQMV